VQETASGTAGEIKRLDKCYANDIKQYHASMNSRK